MLRWNIGVNREEMASWPNTPGIQRVEQAIADLERIQRHNPKTDLSRGVEKLTGNRRDDAEALLILIAANRFNRAGNEEMEQIPGLDNPQTMAFHLSRITATGHSLQTIGLGLCVERLRPGGRVQGTAFSLINRNPHWMGYCPAMKAVAGKTAVIMPDRNNPGMPALTVILPVSMVEGNTAPEKFPPGQARLLRDIFTHHGAAGCIWTEPPYGT